MVTEKNVFLSIRGRVGKGDIALKKGYRSDQKAGKFWFVCRPIYRLPETFKILISFFKKKSASDVIMNASALPDEKYFRALDWTKNNILPPQQPAANLIQKNWENAPEMMN